jgi:REP element-mobilizing transposase RayT
MKKGQLPTNAGSSDKNMWNDTDIPLAYLITFRTYGTWLPGDERGSVDRFHNIYNEPYAAANARLKTYHLNRLKSDSVKLDARQRKSVDNAVREVCQHKKWGLMALNVRTNHVHLVADIGLNKPEHALNAFKAYSTRKMRQNNCWDFEHSPWVNKGSIRHLRNEKNIEMAVDYVIKGQGADLPKFG